MASPFALGALLAPNWIANWQYPYVLEATQLCEVALESYRADHGEYPESLHLLVTEYLEDYPSTPMESWTGRRYSYRRMKSGSPRLSVRLRVGGQWVWMGTN